jgi:hypothetical protein
VIHRENGRRELCCPNPNRCTESSAQSSCPINSVPTKCRSTRGRMAWNDVRENQVDWVTGTAENLRLFPTLVKGDKGGFPRRKVYQFKFQLAALRP